VELLKVTRFGPVTRFRMTAAVLARPVYQVSAYLLGDTLIDSGCRKTAGALAAWLRRQGIRPGRIVHTHHHEDHTGGDGELVRAFGVRVEAPPGTVPILRRFYRLPAYRRMVWGQPENVEARPLGREVTIGGMRFLVVPTPGHCADHVALFEPERRWLFSGDLYIAPRVVYIRPVEIAREEMASLRRLIALEPEVLFCAHAGVVTDATAALEHRLEHWERLAARAAELVREGLPLRRVRRRLLGREGFMNVISGGNFAKSNLIRSLLEGGPS
jgi:Zn-dependent hydrolases, including glyoxylases